jgi:hypothetical protein
MSDTVEAGLSYFTVHRPFTLYAKAVGFRTPGDFRSELRQSTSGASSQPKGFFDCQRMSIELQPDYAITGL